ncbi:MAG: polysaccharide biosynthesis protein [Bacteroidetes bacterium HGW-Bacteroidetes-14]|nr:MAG: polysaccharide biosynthesis protein [Bacteroidetes bacterium HGW-Bacteroidetes-14]
MANFRDLMLRGERYLWRVMRNFMPRWTIFLFDEFIVVIAFVSLWFFRENIAATPSQHFIFKLMMAGTIFAVTAILFRTYHGVVRFSTMVDLKRLSNSTIAASIVYTALAILITETDVEGDWNITFNYWFPGVLGMMVLAGQFIFRFTVRSFFETFEQSNNSNKIRAFILGSDTDSIFLGNHLLADRSSPYQPVAFVAFRSNQVGKVVNGMPIISATKGFSKHMETYNAKTLILYRSQLEAMPKEFYDRCIVEGLDLMMISTFTRYDENNGVAAPQINKIKIEDLLGRNAIRMDRERIEDQFEGQTILITGAAGSIGSEIARQIITFNCKELLLVDQAETPLNDLWLELVGSGTKVSVKPIIGNVTSQVKMRQIFEIAKPSLVFHAAAYKHVPMMEFHPSAAVVTNVGGTKIVADLCLEFGVKRFVMVSTDKAVNPTNVMGASKRAAEIYVQSLYLKQLEKGVENPTLFVTTRFGNVLGSNGSVVPLFKRQIETGGPVTVTHKEITRYFMTIPEACSLVLEAGCTGNGGEIYIFDMGEAVRIYDLAEKMIRLSGKIPHKDIKIIETGLRSGEKLYEELLATSENTIPTYHKKVMIAKVRTYDYDEIHPEIKDLLYTANKYVYPLEVVRQLKKMIPEFKSQNSKYEALDAEFEANLRSMQSQPAATIKK